MEAWSRRVDPELILSHQEWLERLAHRLVRDPGTADDLTQEAWTVLARRGAVPGGVRGFLAGVVRHLSQKSGRSADRRRRYEEGAARDEATPSTAELAFRLEIQRAVVDALEELEEPYRETLLLRYFEGLSPKEIAARQGVPPGTTRARMSRGLERLRSRLDARFGGDRRAWCLPLLVWLGAPEVRLAIPLLKAGALLLLVAGSLWIAWSQFAVPLADRTDTAVGLSPPLGLATTEGNLEAGGARTTSRRAALDPSENENAPATETPSWTVHARVLDPSGAVEEMGR